mmetsp:Transcript_15570/g.19287  ORF Transcript_15570/g.19287 Transcript_15570/m.19287 type:complete len:233 (+) Transcript_15570:234-932(+)|eukprot:CAMPEP_0204845114 /NCGR_PEP_ID=MMETSP1347-20130617/883_1 /ASSEMBLY_ACC=CAM_ASM_000690 /TAXON_ID=215587 /ORGANISM="Aplanochytrium stocchinoi, Strain GSBS06" /LENGTH=232 /DNA_ID=CAMNT_0051984989 /DNA_START=128 /DNA_END=826 /DNA_ORIENTATION=-
MESLYEKEISELIDTVRQGLENVKILENAGKDMDQLVLPDSESLDSKLQEVGTNITRLTQTIKQLEAQVRTVPNRTTRRALQEKVKEFRQHVKTFDIDHKTLNNKINSQNLFKQSGDFHLSEAEKEHRNRMLQMNDTLDKGTRSLENSRQVMDDLEASAMDVSSQLRSNRETLESAHNKLKNSNNLTSRARSVLRRMENREFRQKTAIYVALGVVALVILYMFYSILFKQTR